jgi:hypothetical protein
MNQRSSYPSLRYFFVACFVFLLTSSSSDALAQRQGGVVMKSLSLVTDLLEHEEVQKELEMSQGQIDSLAKASKTLSGELKDEMREALITGTDFDEFKDGFLERDEKLLRELTDKQQIRLRQLHLQRQGMGFWIDAKVQQALAITPEQNKEIVAIRSTLQSQAQKMASSGELFRDGPDKAMEKLEPLNKEGESKVLQLLTDEQKKKIEQLRGKPFEFPKRMSEFKRGPK